ncbi:hypothetical protein B9Z55_012552 [Caenorhabditis nigoni]|uniref:C3H1-type domain-containing protein n=1 Tax=Caenorhabditis nigoni TaxID=1611254 RepID=A0A2G5TXR3_9PELO|nr:hypothetical protein B9Z55_012547 [Caenorhabditis nigoni]PIC32082.1 hypothetical protein B9Z55_012552 [Caenorhabditis nigoni]
MEQTNYNKLPIRSNIQVDKRKTKLCRHFRKGGDQICHYGSKCIFIHPEDGELYQNLIADTEEYHQQKTMINEKIGKLYQKRKVSSNFKKKQEYAKTINETIRQWNEDYPKAPNYYDLHGMTEQGAIDYVLDIVKWMRVKNVKTSRLETGKAFDISADLQELSQTPVCVVCSGVKSILDIPKTVEYLETHSVNCVVYGEGNVLPSFFTRKSGSKAQFQTESLEEVVELLKTSKTLGLPHGTVLACPIPEKYAADGDLIQQAIDQAVREAIEQNIASQQVTPFILARVNELTQGASMKTNIALLENNASIAGRLAAKLCDRRPIAISKMNRNQSSMVSKPKVVSIGAAIVDFEAITNEDVKDDGGSYNGRVVQRMGGVARNHAEALGRLGCESIFVSAIGDDQNGQFFRQNSEKTDITRVQMITNRPTCTYLAVNVKGNVKYGIVTSEPLLSTLTPKLIEANSDVLECSDFILLDSNLPVPLMAKTLEIAKKHEKQVWLEPTDIDKVKKVFSTGLVDAVTATSPNANEFLEWAKLCNVKVDTSIVNSADSVLELIEKEKRRLLLNTSLFVVTLANKGSAVVHRNKLGQLEFQALPPPLQMDKVVSVSGAGDSFNSGVIAGLTHNKSVVESLQLGQECARLTLQTTLAVSEAITPQLLK